MLDKGQIEDSHWTDYQLPDLIFEVAIVQPPVLQARKKEKEAY